MLHLLVDTCVWLDLAKDYREQPVISALEDLIAARQIKLIVPQVVLDEFSRNKGRVVEDARRGLQSHFRLVREAVNRFGEDEYRSAILAALNEVDHKIFTRNESAIGSVEQIEKLLIAQLALATTDAIKCSVPNGRLPIERPITELKTASPTRS
jgi:PIN domain